MKSAVVVVALGFLVLGCDPLGEKKAEREAAAREEAESRRQAEERDRFAKSISEYANGRLKLVKERMTSLTRDLGVWRTDVDRLSEIMRKVREEKTAQGNGPNQETCLLNLIRNPEVNAFARKYLAADFTGEQGEFIERVRAARESEAAYRKAREQSEANYDAMLQSAQKWVNATAEQRNAEIARIQGELNSLEQRRTEQHKSFQELTRKTLVGNVAQERQRLERLEILKRKISDADYEISVKRRQIDLLRNPDAMRGMESKAAERVQTVQHQANAIRERNLTDIERYYKPSKTVTDVVAEWTAKTVGKLRGAISEKVLSAEKELAALMVRKTTIQECQLAIPVSNLAELRQIRTRLEK